ncbi:MAG: peptidylprolyl isomerase [Anaerolineae bacterium]
MRRVICSMALGVAIGSAILVGCSGQIPSPGTPEATATTGEGLAAVVNGEPITMEDYQKQVYQVEAFFQQEGLDLESEEGRERLAQARRQVLEQMIDQVLIRQAAVEMDVSISDAELESNIQEIVEQSGGQEQFNQSLQATETSYDDFRQMLLDQLLSEAVFSAVTESVSSVGEQVHARHILLPTRERAEEVLARLQGGEDFAFLAREYSEDISSRESGGDMGFFPRGVMPAEVEDGAFSLDVGEISEIIESPFGFHILQVLEKEEREIAVEIFENLRQQTLMKWLEERRGSATIERVVE